MASTILTSRNYQRSSAYLSKFPNNRSINLIRVQNVPNPNTNPNPNSNPSHFFTGYTSRNIIHHQQLPQAANSNGYRYITFRISSYTKSELKHLKKRLVSDLERVRILQKWIYFTTMKNMNYNPNPNPPEIRRTVGRKRTDPIPPVRDRKKQCGRIRNVQKRKLVMKKCEQVLGKLMQHKHGWVFNAPVDAAALKLYDYHNIITNPMDLGTIKMKLSRNKYDSPIAFASDVRLTFQNAMVYNGRGSAVYIMAECLLLLFEDLFDSSYRADKDKKRVVNQVMENRSASVPVLVGKIEKPTVDNAVRVLKKAEMTDEMKSELAESFSNLQLGPEGINQIMAILKKGVLGLEHLGDEIELDLAVLDDDTLWALHGFIDRARKGGVTKLISSVQYAGNESLVEEDVDIGEEMEMTVFPSVEIERDAVDISSSESSSDSAS